MSEIAKPKKKVKPSGAKQTKPVLQPNLSLLDHMKQIYAQAQESWALHDELIDQLFQLLVKHGVEEFYSDFEVILCYLLQSDGDCKHTFDDMLTFLSKFLNYVICNERELGEPEQEILSDTMFNKIMSFIIETHSANLVWWRINICKLVRSLLNTLSNNATIDDQVFEDLRKSLINGAYDRHPKVRKAACESVHRLQDPRDENCPVTNMYLDHLQYEPNADVVRVVLKNVSLSRRSLPFILKRTRDVRESIRVIAFDLFTRIKLAYLAPSERVHLLKYGLQDKSESVKKTVEKLFIEWWNSVDRSLLKIMEYLEVFDNAKALESVVATVLRKLSLEEALEQVTILNDSLVVPPEELNLEKAFLWKAVYQFIHSTGEENEDFLEKLAPSVCNFMDYIASYIKTTFPTADEEEIVDCEFIAKQLMEILCSMDLSDEFSRRHVSTCLHELLVLSLIRPDFVDPLMQAYKLVEPSITERSLQVAQLISEIREPSDEAATAAEPEARKHEVEVKVASIRVQLHECRDRLENAIKQKEYRVAEEIDKKISELEREKERLLEDKQESKEVHAGQVKDDPDTLAKCLAIFEAFLLNGCVEKKLTPAMRTIKDELVNPCIPKRDPTVRWRAFSCLGICCVMDRELAARHLFLFLEVAEKDPHEVVVKKALERLFDMFIIYGFDSFATNPQSESGNRSTLAEMDRSSSLSSSRRSSLPSYTREQLVNFCFKFIDSENYTLRYMAVEAFCRLMVLRRVLSATVFMRTVLIWFDPECRGEGEVRWRLAEFFHLFASVSDQTRCIIEEAFVPTLNYVIKAPPHSSFSTVDPKKVAHFFQHLFSLPTAHSENVRTSQEGLAEQISTEILKAPHAHAVRAWVDILNSLNADSGCRETTEELLKLANQMCSEVKTAIPVKILQNYRDKLHRILDKIEAEASQKTLTESQHDETIVPQEDEPSTSAQPAQEEEQGQMQPPPMPKAQSEAESGSEESDSSESEKSEDDAADFELSTSRIVPSGRPRSSQARSGPKRNRSSRSTESSEPEFRSPPSAAQAKKPALSSKSRKKLAVDQQSPPRRSTSARKKPKV